MAHLKAHGENSVDLFLINIFDNNLKYNNNKDQPKVTLDPPQT